MLFDEDQCVEEVARVAVLKKCVGYGIGEFDQLPRVLQVSPFDDYWFDI